MIAALAFAALAPVTLVFGGDVMLGRGIESAGKPPFGVAASVLSRADLAFVNLECVLSELPFESRKSANLRARPERVRWLTDAGIDVVSVANNHSGDCGAEGLRESVAVLEAAGIAVAGLDGGLAVRRARGVSVGFLALTDFARDAARGVAVVAPETIEEAVRGAASQVDHLVVSVHWGVEGASKPTSRQRELAARAVRGGARVVVGHGPHKVQPVEDANGLVAYSLGDLVFDRRGERVLLEVTLAGAKPLWRLVRLPLAH